MQSLCAQGTDFDLNLCISAALFPEKNPSAAQTTKGSDDFVTDSEDDGAKQNGDVNGEHGARRDGSRAAGNKRGKVGVNPLPAAAGGVELGSHPVGVPAIPVWEPAEGAKLFRIDFPCVPDSDLHPEV